MHRMLFEDLHDMGFEVHFACPTQYHNALIDHPHIHKLLDSAEVDHHAYISYHNTSQACGNYEMNIAPRADLHRSDIWAKHCGFTLTKHNMHIRLTDNEKIEASHRLKEIGNGQPVVLLAPYSAISSKDLDASQIQGVARSLTAEGYRVVGLHSSPVGPLVKEGLPSFSGLGIRQWMALISLADYIISVDTAAIHCAGGLGKPAVGIFTWASGPVYTKYYPTVEVVQKPQEWGCGPCYNWFVCPKSKKNRKPCATEITAEDIMLGFRKLVEKTTQHS